MDSILIALQDFLGDSGAAGILFMALAAAAAFALSMGLSAFVLGLLDPVRRRLGQLGSGSNERPSAATTMADSLSSFAAFVTPRSDRERQRVERLLIHAGYRSPSARTLYYGVKALVVMILPMAVLLASPLLPRITTNRLMLFAAAAGYLGWVACSMWLDRQVANRQRALRAAFPDALDLLVVCVESGLGLAPALARVADELAVSHPALGDELALVNAEMRAGVERGVALKNLSERTGLEDIRGMTALLVQTMRFGTSIADALRVYSEEFRDKRTQAAEEQAAKIGTKMIFPLVLFIFPSFFLVVIGPAVIGLIEVFSQIGK
ncbi:type II secretion system F family protein [Steroidobacter flavus]|uniref:Type II secretion system F family protein n=1 Tax=Steroidobacter flavus TaxID=1842136 RepID=A0ABV8T3H8_9GAMM